jgi:hypothetical protein
MSRSPTSTHWERRTHPLLQGIIADWHSRPGGAWSALPDSPVRADVPLRWTRTSRLFNRIRSRARNRVETATDRDRNAIPSRPLDVAVTRRHLRQRTAGVGCDHGTGDQRRIA